MDYSELLDKPVKYHRCMLKVTYIDPEIGVTMHFIDGPFAGHEAVCLVHPAIQSKRLKKPVNATEETYMSVFNQFIECIREGDVTPLSCYGKHCETTEEISSHCAFK